MVDESSIEQEGASAEEDETFSELQPESVLFRAIRSKALMKDASDSRGLSPEIYQLRWYENSQEWEKGLSVGLSERYKNQNSEYEDSAHEYSQNCGLNKCHGVMSIVAYVACSVKTQTIPCLNLSIENDKPNHWQIIGMPTPHPTDLEKRKESERVGGLLRNLSKLEWPEKKDAIISPSPVDTSSDAPQQT